MAQGYQAHLPNRVVPLRGPQNPGAVGAAVAQGVAQVAETGRRVVAQDYQLNEELRRRDRQQQVAAGMGVLADAQLGLDRELQTLRTTKAQPGAAGHEQAAAEAFQRAQQQVLDALPEDPEVRDHFSSALATWKLRTLSGEDDWALAQRVRFGAAQADKLGDQMNAGLLSAPDAATWRRNIESMDALFAGMGLEPDQLALAQRRFEQGHTKALIDGLRLAGKWQAAKAIVESGELDAELGDDKKGYLAQFANDAAIAAREAEAAGTERRQAAQQQLDALKVMIDNGEAVPDATIRQAIEAGRAAGVPDAKLLEAGFLSEHAANRRSYAAMSTPVLEQQLAGLRQRQDAGRISPAESRALEDADKELKGRDTNDAAKLGPMLKGGVEGRIMGVASLAAMPADQRRRVAEAAGDPQAAIVAGLPSEARPWAVAGHAKRLAAKDAYLPKVAQGEKPEAEIDRQFRSVLGSLAGDIGGDYGLVRDTALDIMANATSGWDARQFGKAIQVAAGMTRRGDGSNQGGIGTVAGRQVELPPFWNQAEFDRALSRHDFPGAVYANGQPAKAEDVRKNFRLKFDHMDGGSTVYQLIGADGRPLVRRTGRGVEPYYLQVAERP